MSESKFEGALNALQNPQDGATFLKLVIAIRREVEWPKNKDNITKLREKECLKPIVMLLQFAQKSVVDVCLSILGNCLMDRACTREAVAQLNIISVINQLLKKQPKDDSTNGRIFRIIGNICQHRDQWANIIIDKKPLIVTYIVDFVKKISKDEKNEENVSDATVVMAVRSLRELLNSQTIMPLVKNFGVLKAIGCLFIKYSEEWQKTKKNEKLLKDIIRLLQEYSRYKYYHSIIEMRSTDRGDSLIYLSSVLVLAPRKIVKIVMNFIRISQLKSELPIPEICDRFIQVLENYSIVKEFDGECIEYLQCLCYLLEHPANRNSERCGKCIPLLIKVLKEFQEVKNDVLECCILLIATLNKFKYDDNLLLAQLKCGIIGVLLEKLHWLVGTSKTLGVKHNDEKKRKYKCEEVNSSLNNRRYGIKYDELKLPRSPSSSDEELDFLQYNRFNRSPSPCSSSDSELHALSWSSPCSSPKSFANELSDSDSDDYSPVCSEADCNDFPLSLPQADHENCNSSDDHRDDVVETIQDDEDIGTEKSTDKNISLSLKIGLLMEITKLLKSYIKLRPPVPHLASEELLLALLKCSGNFEWTFSANIDTIDVICRILDSHDYLLPLMRTEFIQTLYNLTEIQHNPWCTKCSQYQYVGQTILKKFTFLAESGVGKGDIANKLLRGDDSIRQHLVLNIPYIVKNRTVLAKLMVNCGGLEVLMKLLIENTDLKNRCIKVLCAMASRKLAIANPKQVNTGLDRPKVMADRYKLSENCEHVVAFRLDDGNILKADRNFLIEKSDFFSRLLDGNFKESKEDEISLHNVLLKSFRCLLHLLASVDKSETIEIDLDLDTLLDVILLSDRYLMVDLCLSLTNSVEQFRISAETVPLIYRWSLESGTNLLRVESVAYALVGDIDESERLKMFENLFGFGFCEQLAEDIRTLLVRYLTLTDYNKEEAMLKRKQSKLHLNRMRDNMLKRNARINNT